MVLAGFALLPIGFFICGFALVVMPDKAFFVRDVAEFLLSLGIAWSVGIAGIAVLVTGSFLILKTARF
jgi:hypothetical protein